MGKETAKGRAVRSDPPHTARCRYSGSSFTSELSNDAHSLKAKQPDLTATQPCSRIPKSRTFSVLSSLTQSFSRGSLSSRGTSSRHVSGESVSSSIDSTQDTIRKPSYVPLRKSGSQSDTAALKSPTLTSTTPRSPSLPAAGMFWRESISPPTGRPSANLREITTAMPPQYWAGRFMALQDRFHNELLEPFHLSRMCEVQAAPRQTSAQASAAAQNNPSTSAYAITRARQASNSSTTAATFSRLPNSGIRIPQSATSGAILQSTPYTTSATTTDNPPPSYEQMMRLSSSRYPSLGGQSTTLRLVSSGTHHLLPASGTASTITTIDENAVLEYAHHTGAAARVGMTTNSRNDHLITSSTTATTPTQNPSCNLAPTTTTAATTAVRGATTGLTAAVADDETSRARRVFLHLARLCTTAEARASLLDWQVQYACRLGRPELLPAGACMRDGLEIRRAGGKGGGKEEEEEEDEKKKGHGKVWSIGSSGGGGMAGGDGIEHRPQHHQQQQHRQMSVHEFSERGKELVRRLGRLRRSLIRDGHHNDIQNDHHEKGRDGDGGENEASGCQDCHKESDGTKDGDGGEAKDKEGHRRSFLHRKQSESRRDEDDEVKAFSWYGKEHRSVAQEKENRDGQHHSLFPSSQAERGEEERRGGKAFSRYGRSDDTHAVQEKDEAVSGPSHGNASGNDIQKTEDQDSLMVDLERLSFGKKCKDKSEKRGSVASRFSFF
ncbi:hypothetical protein VTI74DRAFT_8685 [Chaetomium olivicolor]